MRTDCMARGPEEIRSSCRRPKTERKKQFGNSLTFSAAAAVAAGGNTDNNDNINDMERCTMISVVSVLAGCVLCGFSCVRCLCERECCVRFNRIAIQFRCAALTQ